MNSKQKSISRIMRRSVVFCAAILVLGFTALQGSGAFASAAPAALGSSSQFPLPVTASIDQSSTPHSAMSAISCPTSTTCVAGGYVYPTSNPSSQVATIVEMNNGSWGAPISINFPSSAGERESLISYLQCPSTGNCSAAGIYYAPNCPSWNGGLPHCPFVVNEVAGTWGTAIPLTDVVGQWSTYGFSCATAGNCVLVGNDSGASGSSVGSGFRAIAYFEHNGTWGSLQPMANFPSYSSNGSQVDTNGGNSAIASSVGCSSSGACAMGGWSTGSDGNMYAWVLNFSVSISAGSFAQLVASSPFDTTLEDVPGSILALPTIACDPSGNCMAVVTFETNNAPPDNTFVTTSAPNGSWSTPISPLGSYSANGYGGYDVTCPATGSCTLVGSDESNGSSVLAATSSNGTTATGDWTQSQLFSSSFPVFSFSDLYHLSCWAAGSCQFAYSTVNVTTQNGDPHAFTTTETNGTWGSSSPLNPPSSQWPGIWVNGNSCASDAVCNISGSLGLTTTYSGGNAMVLGSRSITSIAPGTSSPSGGGTLTITGTNLSAPMTVTIGGVACANVTIVSSTTATCVIPAGAPGAANVVVTSPGGNITIPHGLAYLAAPSISKVSPATGSTLGGTKVSISGSGFATGTTVSIGSVHCKSVRIVSATTLTCITPKGTAGKASVIVTTPVGRASLPNAFTYATPSNGGQGNQDLPNTGAPLAVLAMLGSGLGLSGWALLRRARRMSSKKN